MCSIPPDSSDSGRSWRQAGHPATEQGSTLQDDTLQTRDTLRLAVRTVFTSPEGVLLLRYLHTRAQTGHSQFSRHTQPLELAFIEGRRSLVWEIERLLTT